MLIGVPIPLVRHSKTHEAMTAIKDIIASNTYFAHDICDILFMKPNKKSAIILSHENASCF